MSLDTFLYNSSLAEADIVLVVANSRTTVNLVLLSVESTIPVIAISKESRVDEEIGVGANF